MSDRNIITDETRNLLVHVYHCPILNIGATPVRMGSKSPRITLLNQMLDSSPIATSPIIIAPGATKTEGCTFGVMPSYSINIFPSFLLGNLAAKLSPNYQFHYCATNNLRRFPTPHL